MQNNQEIHTYDEFLGKYTPELNQVLKETFIPTERTSYEDMTSYGGCMYETFGKEMDYIKEQPNKRVWTLIDSGGKNITLIAGKHFINRMGYIVTEQEWQDEFEEYQA